MPRIEPAFAIMAQGLILEVWQKHFNEDTETQKAEAEDEDAEQETTLESG